MSLKCLCLIVATLSLLRMGQSLDWQGYGNMSSSNLTVIWAYIDNNINSASTANNSASYYAFTGNFSALLNSMWDPAWNVFLLIGAAGKDNIFYGYSFRNHWMWFNGYTINGLYFSFVIWKDFNCQGWMNIGQGFHDLGAYNVTKTYATAALSKVNKTNGVIDIWGETQNFMNALVTKVPFIGDKAFSIIVTEDLSAKIYGTICLVGNNYFLTDKPTFQLATNGGRFLFFQTR